MQAQAEMKSKINEDISKLNCEIRCIFDSDEQLKKDSEVIASDQSEASTDDSSDSDNEHSSISQCNNVISTVSDDVEINDTDAQANVSTSSKPLFDNNQQAEKKKIKILQPL